MTKTSKRLKLLFSNLTASAPALADVSLKVPNLGGTLLPCLRPPFGQQRCVARSARFGAFSLPALLIDNLLGWIELSFSDKRMTPHRSR
jgi:hypothetical protein